MGTEFDTNYRLSRQGMIVPYPFLFVPGNPQKVYQISGVDLVEKMVVRDASGRLSGLADDSTIVADLRGNQESPPVNMSFGPENVLFVSTGGDEIGTSTLLQFKNGSKLPNKVDSLGNLGIQSHGQHSIVLVPPGLPGSGRLKIAAEGTWFDLELKPDGSGTFNVAKSDRSVPFLPFIGAVYIPAGKPGFEKAGLLVTRNGPGLENVGCLAYDVDDIGNPIPSTARVMVTAIDGWITTDPSNGEILLTTLDPSFLWVTSPGTQGPAPSIQVVDPLDGAEYSLPSTPIFFGSATQEGGGITLVKLLRNGLEVGQTTEINGRNEFSIEQLEESEGRNVYTLVARGVDGQETVSKPITIIFSKTPNRLPSVRLISNGPTEALACQTLWVLVSTSDSDGSIASVFLSLGTNFIGKADAKTLLTPIRELQVGTYRLNAKAIDNRGGQSTASLEVTVSAPRANTISAGFGYDGLFHVCYGSSPGNRYALDRAITEESNTKWISVSTNLASSTLTKWIDPTPVPSTAGGRYYRVRKLP